MAKKSASSSKLGNKRLNRLAKQGKLRPKRKPARNGPVAQALGTNEKAVDSHAEDAQLEENSAPSDEDVNYFTSSASATGFAASFRKSVLSAKRPATESIEELYEQKAKKKPSVISATVRHLLPIKDKNRLIPRTVEVESLPASDAQCVSDTLHPASSSDLPLDAAAAEEAPIAPLTAAQLFAERQRRLRERKARIASLSCSIMENPEQNIGKLRELRLLLEDTDPHLFVVSRKLTIVSLLEIFKDILPGYRIRIATEKEKQQAASKETKKLRLYEESLLSNYKHYLNFLEHVIKGEQSVGGGSVVPNAHLKAIAVDCLCQLMCERPDFNFFANIAAVLVRQLASTDDHISERVCSAVQSVFRRDKTGGEVSLKLVHEICRLIKARQFGVRSKVLDVFLSLRISSQGALDEGSHKKKQLTHKEKMQTLSRRERKRAKQQKLLDTELEEASAQENQAKKDRTHSDIVKAVFGLYFHVLKKATDSHLLSSVLAGLAKFAHCISVDFFGDLFKAFTELLQKDDLLLKDLLNVVHTAFTIISGQGSALNIDPTAFYTCLYGKLILVPTECDDEEMLLLLTCLDLMFAHRRKQVSMQRVLAFVKRISTISLHMTSPHGAAAVLACVKAFMQTFPRVDILYGNESVGSGVYLPELEEPEHCNAQCTRLYELHTMRRHYSTVVASYAKSLCHGASTEGRGGLSKDLAIQTPAVLFQKLRTTVVDPVTILDSLPKRKAVSQHDRRAKRAKQLVTTDRFLHDEFNHLADLYRSEISTH